MEKQLFGMSINGRGKPYKNTGQMKEISTTNGKWMPKTLEKHCLEKVFGVAFAQNGKPLITNGKSTFSKVGKRMWKTL